MKIKRTIIAFLFGISTASAQHDLIIGSPPGYAPFQLIIANDLAIDPSGNKWIAYSKIGLAKYDGSGWTVYDSLNSPLLKNKVLSVAANVQGVWAGTETGLFNFDGTTWNQMTVATSGLTSDTIKKLYSSGGIDLYIIPTSGFSKYDGSTWQHFNTANSGLVDDHVQCLHEDAAGILWIGTKNGLSKFDGNSWTNFTTSNSSIQDNSILSLTSTGVNSLFLGTSGRAVLLYDGIDFIQFTDYISSYYTIPRQVPKLFPLQNGSILFSTPYGDYYFNSVTMSVSKYEPGFGASDTLWAGAIDQNDQLWKVNRFQGVGKLYMRDSLTSYALNPPPENYTDLDVNQVRCGMFNDNSFHWDLIGTAKYEVPKSTGKNSIFASALWVGGLDPSGKLHIAAQTYRQSGSDFWPGPLDTITAKLDSLTSAQHTKIWKINRLTVDEFITQFNLGNVTNGTYPIPDVIANWPAHGSGNYSRTLAPFTDHNADGVYNPMDGDYPDVKGDQMLWWVMNDNFNIHRETMGIPLGVEIKVKAYAYNCMNIPDSNESVNCTTFYSFEIINRSDTDYHNSFIGLYVDVDLGNYLDDRIGCNVDHDFGFAYNGDNDDEGVSGYGLNPPMMSMALLRGPLADVNDSLDNNHDGVIDESGEHCMLNHFTYYNNNNDPCLGIPNAADDYFNYMRSVNLCGNHFTYGGNGIGGGTGGTMIPTDYFFSGMPYDTGWTEASSGMLPDDRRMLITSGPFSLKKGEARSIDFAYIYTRNESAPNGLTTSIAKNLYDVKNIKHWFETDSFPCNNSSIGIGEIQNIQNDFMIYPNPASENLNVTRKDFSYPSLIEVYNILGEKISSLYFPSGKRLLQIRTDLLAKGIYFLKLINAENFTVKKFVVE